MDSSNPTNTSNAFNAFWKGVEGNSIYNNGLKSDRLTNPEQKTIENGGNREGNDENNNNSLLDIKEVEDENSNKMLEVL